MLLVGEPRFGRGLAGWRRDARARAPRSDGSRTTRVRDFAVAGRDLYPAFLSALRDETGIDVPFDRNGILELVEMASPRAAPAGTRVDRCAHPSRARARAPRLLRAPCATRTTAPSTTSCSSRPCSAAPSRDGRSRSCAPASARVNVDPRAPSRDPRRPRRGRGRIARHRDRRLGRAARRASPPSSRSPRTRPAAHARGSAHAARDLRRRRIHRAQARSGTPGRSSARSLAQPWRKRVRRTRPPPKDSPSSPRVARRVLPDSTRNQAVSHWAGPPSDHSRPAAHPRPRPRAPRLLYACGHGRNGILLAPITGEAIGALAVGAQSPHDISSFAIERFVEAE